MNLSFARAPERGSPGGGRTHTPSGKPLPAGLAGAMPVKEDYDTGFDQLPTPKLLDPPIASLNTDGSIDMSCMMLPRMLSMLLDTDNQGTPDSRVLSTASASVSQTAHGQDTAISVNGGRHLERGWGAASSQAGGASCKAAPTIITAGCGSGGGAGTRSLEMTGEIGSRELPRKILESRCGDGRRRSEKVHMWGNIDKVWPQPVPGIAGVTMAATSIATTTSSHLDNHNNRSNTNDNSNTDASSCGGGPASTCWSTPSVSIGTTATTTTPTASAVGQRLGSQTSSASKAATTTSTVVGGSASVSAVAASTSATAVSSTPSRLPEIMGTSPGTGIVGSPDSLGLVNLTLGNFSRPFPDRDSKIGAAPQATLKSSPRGSNAGGGLSTWAPSVVGDGARERSARWSDSSEGVLVGRGGVGSALGAAAGAGADTGGQTFEEKQIAICRELFLARDDNVGLFFIVNCTVVGCFLFCSRAET